MKKIIEFLKKIFSTYYDRELVAAQKKLNDLRAANKVLREILDELQRNRNV